MKRILLIVLCLLFCYMPIYANGSNEFVFTWDLLSALDAIMKVEDETAKALMQQYINNKNENIKEIATTIVKCSRENVIWGEDKFLGEIGTVLPMTISVLMKNERISEEERKKKVMNIKYTISEEERQKLIKKFNQLFENTVKEYEASEKRERELISLGELLPMGKYTGDQIFLSALASLGELLKEEQLILSE